MLNVILYSYFTQDIVEGNALNALSIEKVFKAIIELLADKVKITLMTISMSSTNSNVHKL